MSVCTRQHYDSITPDECRERLLRGERGLWQLPDGPLEVLGEAHMGRLLIAHGAGAGQGSTFLQRLRDYLAVSGVQTLAIEFAYLQQMRREGRRRPPPRVDRLVEEMMAWCDTLSHPELPPLWLGGKPERLRLGHWPQLTCPTLVVQGSRDPLARLIEEGAAIIAAFISESPLLAKKR